MNEVRDEERDLEARLGEWQVDGEGQAEERTWRMAAEDFARREPSRRRKLTTRAGITAGLAALFAGLILTPAGAKVTDLVHDAVTNDEPAPEVKLGGLPHVGPLMVRASSGVWIVQPDGSRELLGEFRDAAWSPHGRFVVATTPESLEAVEPDGDARWSLSVDHPASPTWSGSGFRIAYLRGDSVRVVAGDGSGDAYLADAARVAPAWRPQSLDALRSSADGVGTHQLTYADRSGRVHLVDTDSGAELWSTRVSEGGKSQIEELSWSEDGSGCS